MTQTAIQQYFDSVASIYKRGNATEHSYRGDLKILIEALVSTVIATNEPKRIECGAPDYILTTKKEIPIGYIEAKDIGKHLGEVDKSDQLKRYKESLDNLILTDYLTFWWYLRGEKVAEVSLAHIEGVKLKADTGNWPRFEDTIRDFCTQTGQTITNAETLAKMMAAKARMMHHVLETALIQDEADTLNPDTALQSQYKVFSKDLIHDISESEFADIYAQTIAYGMFAARMHDTTSEDFTREKAARLIPSSNPFLRKLFQFIAGYDLDTRLSWIVDTLADVFRATDIDTVLKNFGKSTQQNDPIIHFYETFLKEYNPALRKSRGVWYTPEPVVNFIVRAVDDILKTEFDLKDGLADTSKVKVEVNTQITDKRTDTKYRKETKEFHKVQLLDPATGTGTFLAEVVKQIYKNFEGQQGIWSNYVDEHLIPRLNGFEILMASYAMAHLKLEKLLNDTGHKPKIDQRLRVFLTNSLEEYHPDTDTLFFAQWLSEEANEANKVKRDTPVMVVLGNPPYSGESSNKGKWIMSLMDDYKKEPGGTEKLKEKNPKWVNDDYVKFIRYGQHFIEKNGSGVLAFINPHGFLDNPTFRGMRWNLLKTYDKIYTIDLHGNSNKKELTPDGSPDVNVFDIQQGVSINLFIKTGKKKANELGKVFHFDLFGKREMKYEFLYKNSIKTVPYKALENIAPNYFFVEKDNVIQKEYNSGIPISKLFIINGTGVLTKRDNLCIGNTKEYCFEAASDILNLPKDEFYAKYELPEDVRDWRYEWAKKDIEEHKPNYNFIKQINYRPFDIRYVYYTGRSRGFIGWSVIKVMQHYQKGDNVGLISARSNKSGRNDHFFITKLMSEAKTGESSTQSYNFPLYLNIKNGQHDLYNEEDRKPNLNTEIVAQIGNGLKLSFLPEQTNEKGTFAPIDILDYIYAVLHSPVYREKYKEFLKIDFPRVPYPTDTDKFWQLVKLGGELRQIHLLESPVVSKFITTYPIAGDNTVCKIKYESGKVWINETQYFDKVPQVAWEFYIGGYQPAQKWLKDRKERTLTYDDITHYQKIIVALTETARIMGEIDEVGVE